MSRGWTGVGTDACHARRPPNDPSSATPKKLLGRHAPAYERLCAARIIDRDEHTMMVNAGGAVGKQRGGGRFLAESSGRIPRGETRAGFDANAPADQPDALPMMDDHVLPAILGALSRGWSSTLRRHPGHWDRDLRCIRRHSEDRRHPDRPTHRGVRCRPKC